MFGVDVQRVLGGFQAPIATTHTRELPSTPERQASSPALWAQFTVGGGVALGVSPRTGDHLVGQGGGVSARAEKVVSR